MKSVLSETTQKTCSWDRHTRLNTSDCTRWQFTKLHTTCTNSFIYNSHYKQCTTNSLQQQTRRRSWECTSPPSDSLQNSVFLVVMSGLSLETCSSNLKSVALTTLELLAFKAQKFKGSCDPDHTPFQKIFKGSCPDCPWKHACQIWSAQL